MMGSKFGKVVSERFIFDIDITLILIAFEMRGRKKFCPLSCDLRQAQLMRQPLSRNIKYRKDKVNSMTKQKKEYPELVKVMTKEELDAYCKFYDDMCNPLKKYKDMFIVAEYMSSPRDEYYCCYL